MVATQVTSILESATGRQLFQPKVHSLTTAASPLLRRKASDFSPHPKIPEASSTIFASASGVAPRTGQKYLTFKSLNPQNAQICRRSTFTQPLLRKTVHVSEVMTSHPTPS